jgi:putative transposase
MDVPVPRRRRTRQDSRIASEPNAGHGGRAKAFFRKALKRHGQPRTITLDGFEPSHAALRRMGMRNEFNFRWENPVKIRSCAYLNNIVEQDHRRIKARVQPMLGFKKFYNARRVLIGIEFMQKIHKGKYDLAG